MEIPSATLTQLTEQLLTNKKLITDIYIQNEQIKKEISQRITDNTDNGKILVEINNRFYLHTLSRELKILDLFEVKKAN
jgi:hypothetical protein